jgi:hypothetical protein
MPNRRLGWIVVSMGGCAWIACAGGGGTSPNGTPGATTATTTGTTGATTATTSGATTAATTGTTGVTTGTATAATTAGTTGTTTAATSAGTTGTTTAATTAGTTGTTTATTGTTTAGTTTTATTGTTTATTAATTGTTTGSDGGAATGEGGTGCPGVPLVPDATGYIAPGSNTVGIHGSWFTYSDCTDLMGKNCAMVTSPTGTGFANVGGKMCTSGTTSTATGAWGAGIGLELNDGPPQQPYDTETYKVTGFCFQLSGATIPSTTIRVAFTTQENNDNAPFEAITTPGTHTVLFSDTAQGSWVTTPTVFDPTKVMLVQFQIPSSTAAPIPWDFCIDGMTAVTE